MTPFQRQAFEYEKLREQREEEKQMNSAQSGGMGGGGRTPNAAHPSVPSSGRSKSESVRYMNEGSDDNSQANVSFVD
jgi:hypothetical protein